LGGIYIKSKIIHRNLIAVIIAFSILLIIILLTGCSDSSSNEISDKKLYVCASIFPVYEFVGMIGGDAVDVNIIVPPGGEPHDFEVDVKSAKRLSEADCLFYLGGSIDDWVEQYKKTEQNDNIAYIPLADFHDEHLHEDSHADSYNHHHDPHVWLSPKNVVPILISICDVLVKLDPDNADYFLENLYHCLNRLEELDAVYREKLSLYAGKSIIVAHDAYGYLCSEYGISEMAVSGLEADEPSPGKLAKIIDYIRLNDITHIYFEKLSGEGASYSIVEIIKNDTGIVALELNPFENNESMSKDDDYFSVMYRNLDNILEGFGWQK